MNIYEILAWIVITAVSFVIMPFYTLGIIFYGADMKILSLLCFIRGFIRMVNKTIN